MTNHSRLQERYRLLGTWEVFSVSSDLTLFHCANGRQVEVSHNAVAAYLLAKLADGDRDADKLLLEVCRLSGLERNSVEIVLNELVRKEIFVQSARRIPSISEDQWIRQGHLLEALKGLERPLEESTDYLSRLANSKVVIIGLGGTGSMTAWLLAASGVRRLRLVDPDVVEKSNLGRQYLYDCKDVGLPKVEALYNHLLDYDHDLEIERDQVRIDSLKSASLVLRGSAIAVVTGDVPRTLLNRYIDDAAKSLGVAHLMTHYDRYGPMFIPGVSPCFGCLESHWRGTDERYELLATSQSIKWPVLPATPWGIAKAASAYCEDVVGWLTKAWPPLSIGRQVLPNSTTIPVESQDQCWSCRFISRVHT
jgi:hypothetical protein